MILGYETNYNNVCEIPDETLARHAYIIGKSGAGKSTLLLNMMAQDVKTGRGLLLIDPHGDLAEEFLQFIPKQRLNQIIWIDPISDHCPIVNIFHTDGKVSRDIAAADDLFKSVWPDAWLARSSWFFKKCARSLADVEGKFTIAGIVKVIRDSEYQQKISSRVRKGGLKSFWRMFYRYQPRLRDEIVTPVLNKSEEFIDNEYLAALTGREESTFSVRWAMDNNKIIICKFPRGSMGKEGSKLACSIMLSKVNNAGLARADSRKRSDFTVYVDEAGMALQGVDTPSLMSESRKFGLRLVFATQTNDSIAEVSNEALASILGNCGTLITFTLYGKDAEYLDQEFYGQFPPSKYVGLQMKHMMVRTLKDGSPSSIIEVIGRPKPRSRRNLRQREEWSRKVKETSKRRFAVSKEATLEKVDHFLDSGTLDTNMDMSMDIAYRKSRRKSIDKYSGYRKS